MAEIRKGFSWGSLISFVGLILIVTYLAWSATKKTDTENYTKGATHNESTVNITPNQHAYPLGCSRFIIEQTPDGIRYVDETKQKAKR